MISPFIQNWLSVLRTRLETPFDLACCIAFTAAYKKSIAKFKYKKISINQNFSFKVTIEIKKYLFPDNTKVISGIKSNICLNFSINMEQSLLSKILNIRLEGNKEKKWWIIPKNIMFMGLCFLTGLEWCIM